MILATCHIKGHAEPIAAVAPTQPEALELLCQQAPDLAVKQVRIAFERLPDSGICSPSTVPCDPPTEPVDTDEPAELRVYLQDTRGDWVSAVRVMSYAGGGL